MEICKQNIIKILHQQQIQMNFISRDDDRIKTNADNFENYQFQSNKDELPDPGLY